MNFQISEQAESYYSNFILNREKEIFNLVEIEPLTYADLNSIIIDISKTFESNMNEEII